MPPWIRVVGGPNTLSLWTWLVSLVWTVSVTGLLVPIGEGNVSLPWLGAVAGSQMVLGIGVLLAIRFALPTTVGKPRPVLMLSIFVVLGITRAVTMQIGAELTSYDDGFTLIDRLVFGVVYSVVFGILIALVVDGARRHSSVMAHLRGAEQALDVELRKEESELDRLAQDLVIDVQDRLLAALSDSQLTPEEIRAWARDVVRPLSHELNDDARELGARRDDPELPALKTPLRERAAQIASALRLPSALALAGVAESLAFLLVFQFESPALAATHALVGSGVIVASLWLARQIYRPSTKPSVNLLAVVAAVTFVGIVNVFGTQLVVRFLFPEAATYPLYVVTVILIGLALSLYQAIRLQQGRAEDLLTQAVQQLIARRREVATAIATAHTQAARFLHDSIQGILYAAALRGSPAAEVQQEVEAAFANFSHDRAEHEQLDPRQSLDDLIQMWSTAIPVTLDITDDAARTIFADTSATEALVDVISEGLTNAAKHGTRGHVTVLVDTEADAAMVTITSPGMLVGATQRGIGSRALDAATSAWTLSGTADTTVLRAVVKPGM